MLPPTMDLRIARLLCLLLAGACPAIQAGPDAAMPPDAAPIPPDAAAPDTGPRPLSFQARAVIVTDAGVTMAIDLAPDATTEVAPESRFELELGDLRDVRVQLFDDDDRAVPSIDRLEIGRPTRYSLKPNEPLSAGATYALGIDGLRFDDPVDADGGVHQPARLTFRTTGDSNAAPSPGKPAKTKKKPKKHR
jgi:hypothetical protein